MSRRKRAFDLGAQHLDRHPFAAVGQPRAMHLADRGGGDGGRELGKQGLHRGAKLIGHRGAGGLLIEGRHPVLQHLKLPGKVGADHVGSGRKDLAELDIGGAHGGQRAGRRWQAGVAGIAQPCQRLADKPCQGANGARGLHRVQHHAHGAGAFKRGAGNDQPPDIVRSPHPTVSTPNAAPRRPSSGCGTSPVRNRHRGSSARRSPDRGICGSIRPGTGSCRGRPSPPGPWSG